MVGITFFCIEPKEWKETKTSVGGTKKVKLEVIKKLNPDLIIGCKEENTKVDIEKLKQLFPVWMSDVNDVDEAIDMINSIGQMTGTSEKAKELGKKIKEEFDLLKVYRDSLPSKGKKALYFIWKNPNMVAG